MLNLKRSDEMKDKALLAKYRTKEPVSESLFQTIGVNNDQYLIPINGKQCKVIISDELGDIHLSASVGIPGKLMRLPSYGELLIIKDMFFEEDENLVFGISKNLLMNMTVTNPFAMHLFKYDGPMPPSEKVMEIDDFKVDGDFKITRGKGWGWQFVRILGDHYPDMDEIRRIKNKYAPDRDVAVFLLKDMVILFSNPKEGIHYHRQVMK